MSDHEDPFLRKRPQQSRSRTLVNSVIEAAEQLLAGDEKGEVTLSHIANRAGVGIGSLYDYFSNADSVWGALVARVTQRNFDRLAGVVRSTGALPITEAATRICDETLEMYLDNPAQTRAVLVALVRVGWVSHTVKFRDEYAKVLCERVLLTWPALDRERVLMSAEVFCDAFMGVVAAELWRERSAEGRAKVRGHVHELTRLWVSSLDPNPRVRDGSKAVQVPEGTQDFAGGEPE